MDLFKFTNVDTVDLSEGLSITDYDSIMWIERYEKPGEFNLRAKLSSGLQNILPLGSIISHSKTYEACIVENHEISESSDSDPIIEISGRSLDSYLDNRIVGLQLAINSPTVPYSQYTLAADHLQNQISTLINAHISPLSGDITSTAATLSLTQPSRIIKRQTVLKAVTDLLSLEDLGLRVVRKNVLGAFNAQSSSKTLLHIHNGVDHSNDVIFSWNFGELDSASYLFSIKALKNVALVQGKYVEVVVEDVVQPTDYERRVMLVDASDLDEAYTTVPSGGTLTTIQTNMQTRGREALSSQKLLNISNVDLSKSSSYKYRTDYDIGDTVSISGNYGVTEKRRVVEYVEIEDETGETGYPTLSAL